MSDDQLTFAFVVPERAKPWLRRARTWAEGACRAYGTCDVKKVRDAVGAPPPGVDPRIMGSIFTPDKYEVVDCISSKREACHNRMICEFRLRVGA